MLNANERALVRSHTLHTHTRLGHVKRQFKLVALLKLFGTVNFMMSSLFSLFQCIHKMMCIWCLCSSWASLVFHVDFVNNECDLADFIFICVSNRANINFMSPVIILLLPSMHSTIVDDIYCRDKREYPTRHSDK